LIGRPAGGGVRDPARRDLYVPVAAVAGLPRGAPLL